MSAGECQTGNKKDYDDEENEEPPPPALDEGDIALLKSYGQGPYTQRCGSCLKI
jgi:26S proteasome regulatory subunit T1